MNRLSVWLARPGARELFLASALHVRHLGEVLAVGGDGYRVRSGFLVSTEFLGKKKLCAESKAFVSAGVDPLSDEFRQDGVDLATQEKLGERVSERQRGDHF